MLQPGLVASWLPQDGETADVSVKRRFQISQLFAMSDKSVPIVVDSSVHRTQIVNPSILELGNTTISVATRDRELNNRNENPPQYGAIYIPPSKKERDEENSLKCHISKLVPELLARIMEFAIFHTWRPAKPTHLLLVCWKWHDITLQYPHLWSRLSIDHSTPREVIELYLKRSGNAPLMLTFHATSYNQHLSLFNEEEDNFFHLADIGKILFEHSQRWVYLDVADFAALQILLYLNQEKISLPRLKELKLNTRQISAAAEMAGITVPDSAQSEQGQIYWPNLSSLSITSPFQYSFDLNLITPSVKTLHLCFQRYTSSSQLSGVLARAPSLEALILTLDGESGIPTEALPLLKSLYSITFAKMVNTTWLKILAGSLPNWTHLHLNMHSLTMLFNNMEPVSSIPTLTFLSIKFLNTQYRSTQDDLKGIKAIGKWILKLPLLIHLELLETRRVMIRPRYNFPKAFNVDPIFDSLSNPNALNCIQSLRFSNVILNGDSLLRWIEEKLKLTTGGANRGEKINMALRACGVPANQVLDELNPFVDVVIIGCLP